MVITSKENETVKMLKKLKDKKYRDQENCYIIEGIKLVQEALKEKAKIRLVVICDDCSTQEADFSSELKYEIARLECVYVSEKIFSSISNVVNPQGILAVVEKNEQSEIDFSDDLFLVLDDIQDPGNMGTILRTADSLNFKQIIISKGSSDVYNPKVVRSTMGAIFRIKIVESDDLVKLMKELKRHKIKVVTTSLQTDKSMYDISYDKTAIVIGNEANGVRKEIQELADERVKIPMLGKTESLNASVATAVVLYEAMRDRLR